MSTDRTEARRLLIEAGGDGVSRVEDLVVPALESLGVEWEAGRASLSQMFLGGRMCANLVGELLPPSAEGSSVQPTMAIATFEDYHMLGKRIVYSVLRAGGFELLDYGRVDADQLVERVEQDGVEVLLLSVLMLPSALSIKQLRPRLGPGVRILVGGAPFRFDPELWRQVGADGMGTTATEALALVRQIIAETP